MKHQHAKMLPYWIGGKTYGIYQRWQAAKIDQIFFFKIRLANLISSNLFQSKIVSLLGKITSTYLVFYLLLFFKVQFHLSI